MLLKIQVRTFVQSRIDFNDNQLSISSIRCLNKKASQTLTGSNVERGCATRDFHFPAPLFVNDIRHLIENYVYSSMRVTTTISIVSQTIYTNKPIKSHENDIDTNNAKYLTLSNQQLLLLVVMLLYFLYDQQL